MSNNARSALIGIIIAVAAGAGVWWYSQNSAHPLSLAEGDTIASWNFQGTHKDGGALEKKVNDEITRQKGLLGGDQSGKNDDPTDYILYIGIANQYELLGDGREAYEYLGRALKIDSTKTGLAWRNLGSLLERLGAPNTARAAYAHAVEAQPHIIEFHLARLRFLVNSFSEDTAAVEAAFGEAEEASGETPEVLQIKAEWYKKTGHTEEAISAMQKIQSLMGDSSLESEIARMRSL